MTITTIILIVLLIAALIWGRYHYKWHNDHKEDVRLSLNRLQRIEALTRKEDVHYVYSVKYHYGAYYVVMFNFETGPIPVKRFYDEDRDYAYMCAEELCEKLNEKI